MGKDQRLPGSSRERGIKDDTRKAVREVKLYCLELHWWVYISIHMTHKTCTARSGHEDGAMDFGFE